MEQTLTSNLPIKIEGLNKSAIESLSERIVSSVVEGSENSGDLYIKLDFLKKSIDKSLKTIKEDAVVELSKYDKGQTVMGVEINVTSKASYKYDNNPEWVAKKAELKKIEEQMKMVNKDGVTIVNEETGEVVPPAIANYSDAITPKYPKA